MTFKSMIIFALVASAGRAVAAPLANRHLDSRNHCQGTGCARDLANDGHPDLARRLAQFGDPSVTLSSGPPGTSTVVDPSATSVDPFSPTSSIDQLPTLPVDPYSTISANPSSTPSLGDTLTGNPQATDPAAGDPATVTVISTIFLTLDPSASLPTQSLPPSDTAVPPIPTVNPSVPGTDPLVPGVNPSVSGANPTAIPSPTVIELSDSVPGSSVSSEPASQPTPSPSPTAGGIVFLPGDDNN